MAPPGPRERLVAALRALGEAHDRQRQLSPSETTLQLAEAEEARAREALDALVEQDRLAFALWQHTRRGPPPAAMSAEREAAEQELNRARAHVDLARVRFAAAMELMEVGAPPADWVELKRAVDEAEDDVVLAEAAQLAARRWAAKREVELIKAAFSVLRDHFRRRGNGGAVNQLDALHDGGGPVERERRFREIAAEQRQVQERWARLPALVRRNPWARLPLEPGEEEAL